MAVWLARPPASVAKPEHAIGIEPRGLARRQVVRQDQMAGAGSSSWNDLGSSPINWPRIRASMSRTSAARAARWEPVSRSSRAACASSTSRTACSAETCSCSTWARASRAEGRIGDHPAVGRQDVGVLRAEPGSGLALGLLGLSAGSLQPAVEPLQLARRPPLP